MRHVRAPKRILAIAVPAAYVVLCLLLYSGSVDAASDVQHGISVANPSVNLGAVSVPLVGIRATTVTVDWRDEPPDALESSTLDPGCLMHLGESEGRVLLYDVRQEKLVRIPAADAIFTLDVEQDLPEGCIPPTSG